MISKKARAGLFLVPALILMGGSAALALDSTLENLDISGMLRVRAWYTGSQVKVPDKFPADEGYNSVDYQDLFFRNRFNLKALPNLEIRAVFDIVSVFGKNDFALGNGSANLVTRDVYAVFSPFESAEISVGLQPFSFPGGYILARDASGVQYSQQLLNRSLKLYGGFINAFDDADRSYGENTAPPEYADDNIYFIGATANFASMFYCDLYYIFEYDRYADIDRGGVDKRFASLHWIGLHAKFVWNNWMVRAGAIANRGGITLQETAGKEKNGILAWLGEFEAGYQSDTLRVSVIAEGATGDPNDPDAGASFQAIGSSHEFSLIVVDNYGGLAIRGADASPWYGLYGAGAKLQYTMFNSVNIELRLLHFRTTRALTLGGDSTTWFGDEADFRAEYIYRDALSIFFTAGVFRPNGAYFALESVRNDHEGCVVEIMLGSQVVY